MNVLETALADCLGQLPQKRLAALVVKQLREAGLKLSRREARLVEEQVVAGQLDRLRLRRWQWWDSRDIAVTITEEDVERIEKDFEQLCHMLPEIVDQVIVCVGPRILKDLRRRWPARSRWERREETSFERRLYDRWSAPFELLRMLLTCAREFGETISNAVRVQGDVNQAYSVDVLSRLHARACQVTHEVVSLLGHGLADGAMARWRTLHEIAVVAFFVSNHGEEMAERFALHQTIEFRRALREYCERLGCDLIDGNELADAEKECHRLKSKFGHDFGEPYGWAAKCLQKEKPTFADIERAVGIEHFRPLYRMASYNVHVNSRALFCQLGLLDDAEVLLAGPSDVGLADPGRNTAISLVQASVPLLHLRPTFDNNLCVSMMWDLAREVGDQFCAADAELLREAAQVRNDAEP